MNERPRDSFISPAFPSLPDPIRLESRENRITASHQRIAPTRSHRSIGPVLLAGWLAGWQAGGLAAPCHATPRHAIQLACGSRAVGETTSKQQLSAPRFNESHTKQLSLVVDLSFLVRIAGAHSARLRPFCSLCGLRVPRFAWNALDWTGSGGIGRDWVPVASVCRWWYCCCLLTCDKQNRYHKR